MWFSIIASLVFIADWLAKALSSEYLRPGVSHSVIPGLFTLRLTHNRGIALGLFSGNTGMILVMPLLAIALGVVAFRKYRMTRFTGVASALVMGGFFGNFVDRLINGYVVDMIFFPFLPFFICNIADIAICAGVAMLMISLMVRPRDWIERRAGTEYGKPSEHNADGGD